jgi:hypothetical protein
MSDRYHVIQVVMVVMNVQKQAAMRRRASFKLRDPTTAYTWHMFISCKSTRADLVPSDKMYAQDRRMKNYWALG